MKLLKKIVDFTDVIFENVSQIFLVLMTVIVSAQVFTRYFLDFTPYWSEEVALLLMVWFGFIGMALGVKQGIHIAIEYFVSLLPQSLQVIAIKIDHIISAAFGVFLAVYGSKLVDATKVSTLPATQWPSLVLYFMAPVSGIMIIIYSVYNLASPDSSKKAAGN